MLSLVCVFFAHLAHGVRVDVNGTTTDCNSCKGGCIIDSICYKKTPQKGDPAKTCSRQSGTFCEQESSMLAGRKRRVHKAGCDNRYGASCGGATCWCGDRNCPSGSECRATTGDVDLCDMCLKPSRSIDYAGDCEDDSECKQGASCAAWPAKMCCTSYENALSWDTCSFLVPKIFDFVVDQVQGMANTALCGTATAAIGAGCVAAGMGPEDPIADLAGATCATLGITLCAKLLGVIEDEAFSKIVGPGKTITDPMKKPVCNLIGWGPDQCKPTL
eukprot:TRINITY_DN3132_c0_g1_i1.p1 TRINITY_DN3132_c0_g1~~TRINITY_DN3132_c0_g1_i1.p1  ORF type:complete len:274 (+),score=31.94 TRINITY_DN3132_c0_g1_i1:68-889(+)